MSDARTATYTVGAVLFEWLVLQLTSIYEQRSSRSRLRFLRAFTAAMNAVIVDVDTHRGSKLRTEKRVIERIEIMPMTVSEVTELTRRSAGYICGMAREGQIVGE